MTDLITLRLSDFGLKPNTGEDSTPAVRSALESIGKAHSVKIKVEKGQYHFRPELASEEYIYPSNNDAGLRRILFLLTNVKHVEVDGSGSRFIFHGNIVPFYVNKCASASLHDFTIDWHIPFNAETIVEQVGPTDNNKRTAIDLHIPDAYPYTVSYNQLYFTDDTGLKQTVSHSLEWDAATRETAYDVFDNWHHRDYHYAEELEPGLVRFTSEFSSIPAVGNILALVHNGRECPGIFVTDSANVDIADVTIHHCGGMGLIAQRTTDIEVKRMTVAPALDKNRYVSATADATHFVNCAGTIKILDSYFQGQLDDATNVHGIYCRISRIVSNREFEMELVHGQQAGIQITQAGDELEFVNNDDLLRYHTDKVVKVTALNYQFFRVKLAHKLSKKLKIGDGVASINWTPNLIVRGCKSLKNRARALLISTAGKVLIEKNCFHTPGATIVIAGDANYWFESGCVGDVTIRENHFDNCNYGTWGESAIDILPEIELQHRGNGYYHSNITVEDNVFDVFDTHLVSGRCVDGFVFKNNTINLSTAYPHKGGLEPTVVLTESTNVHIELS